MKSCTKCGDTKPLTEFNKDARARDGLQSQCRACAKAHKAKYYAANPDKVKAVKAKWNEANREKRKASIDKWYAANPEKRKANCAKWAAANPEARRINEQNRRASKRANSGKLSAGLAERLHKLQRGKCACGCKQPLGADYHLDHRMPLALGGSNTDDNMQLLTATCNRQKHAKHPIDFMQNKGFLL